LDFLKEQGWENISGDILLERHKQNRKSDDNKTKYELDDLIPKFIQWLKENKGMKHNSAINTSVPIRGFFKFHREPLRVQKSSNTTYKETKKKYHIFTQEELQRMVKLGDIEEKAIILLGKDLGVRVGDFIEIKRSPILEAFKDQKGEFPIEFEIETTKEGILSVGHISQETWEALQDYWSNMPQSEFVFPSNGSHISEDKVSFIIRNSWSRAFPDRNDVQTRFHELRSFKMTVLSDCGINEWHIKKMVGKKLSSDISTYLRGANLKEDFKKAMPKLSLTGHSIQNGERLEQFEKTIVTQQKEIQDLKTRFEATSKNYEKEIEFIKEIQTEIMKRNLQFQLDNNLITDEEYKRIVNWIGKERFKKETGIYYEPVNS
jgi:hypothetical protein